MTDLKSLIREIKNSNFVLGCEMPLGYVEGYPILQIRNQQLCLVIPFLKYKVTGAVDKTLVFPIRYAVTVILPEKKIVKFEDLSTNPIFAKVDFEKPIGYFRHDSIKQFNKSEYKAKKDELYGMYDKIIDALLGEGDYSAEDDEAMKELAGIMLEPSLKPIYRVLDSDFYNKYLV